MTSKEFVVWMQGFVEACNDYSPTPKQWDTLKDKLGEVKDESTPSFPFGVPNTAPIQTLPFIQPYKPYEVYCGTDTKLTVSSGSGSSGTITYNPSTTTIWNPSGSNWSYTTTLPQQPTTGSNQLELDFESK